ncbi:MAG: ATP-binding protein [Bacteroidales bacterium]|nr:ATP-binding protein [Bacteroidales bacterium]
MNKRYSEVIIREPRTTKKVSIGSKLKPKIISSVIERWQSLIDVTAKIVGVPAGLVMQLKEDSIKVFLKSNTDGNPYEVGEEAKLIYGLYCETVIGNQKKLLVPDATKSSVWKENNPDIDLNMISYIGLPINWPDKEVFGTVCLLDNKENSYDNSVDELLHVVKDHIETDLRLLVTNKDLVKKNSELKKLNILKSRFLSLLSHDLRGTIGTLDEFIRLLLLRFSETDRTTIKNGLKQMSNSINSIYLTMENLISWSKNELLKLEANKKDVNLVDIFGNILKYFDQTVKLKNLNVKTEFISDEIIVNADKDMLETALRNIISNAIKYTEPGGMIIIRIAKKDNQIIIEIEDTGVGIDSESLKKLFTFNKDHKTKGTKGEKSAGIGLFIIKDFLDKNDAKVKVTSIIGEGTKFVITI